MTFTLPPLAQIVKRTGAVVLGMQAEIVENRRWDLKYDGSIFTAADAEAQKLIVAALREEFPGIAIVSEENTSEENAESLEARVRFETDPLDNTAGYARGHDGFSINLGRLEDGVPASGAIYFPAKGELFFTGEDGRAYRQRGELEPEAIQVRACPPDGAVRLAVGFHETRIEHVRREYEVFRHPAQYRTCMVAVGECDLTGINSGGGFGFNSWDVAAAHAVLRAAGGEAVSMTDRQPMRYGRESKMPPHVCGSLDALVALKLMDLSA